MFYLNFQNNHIGCVGNLYEGESQSSQIRIRKKKRKKKAKTQRKRGGVGVREGESISISIWSLDRVATFLEKLEIREKSGIFLTQGKVNEF